MKKKAKTQIIRTVHDADCPKCDYPETVIIRKLSGEPILEICSSRSCDWGKPLIKNIIEDIKK